MGGIFSQNTLHLERTLVLIRKYFATNSYKCILKSFGKFLYENEMALR